VPQTRTASFSTPSPCNTSLRLYPKVCGMTATARPSADEFEDFLRHADRRPSPPKPALRPHRRARRRLHPQGGEVAGPGRGDRLRPTPPADRSSSAPAASRSPTNSPVPWSRPASLLPRAQCPQTSGREADVIRRLPGAAGRRHDLDQHGLAAANRHPAWGGPRPDGTGTVSLPSGGLYVLGTNRHESRRIDDQLRGARPADRGDPGSTRFFFISLEDDLIRPLRHRRLDPCIAPPRPVGPPPSRAAVVATEIERGSAHHRG